MSKKLYVTHCIDVEGPMTETVEATWDRMREEDNIDLNIEATKLNLEKFQNGELKLSSDTNHNEYLMKKYSKFNLGYLTNWQEIDQKINNVISREFRSKLCDKLGNPYIYNWFIYDHYNFKTNPRFHDDGIHKIFDHYQKLHLDKNEFNDGIYWHYHHAPASGDALEWSTNWFLNSGHEETLARRVIERKWFPSVFRAGGHIERNDINFWLEMFIPFDYSCRSSKTIDRDNAKGLVNDWRHAPKEWTYYHPDFYDYRKKGDMNRYIFRSLDLKTWLLELSEEDVREAFERANSGLPTVLSYYNHDYRDMLPEIQHGYNLIKKIENEYPEVDWQFSNCLDAARKVLDMKDDQKLEFKYYIKNNLLTIESNLELFGPEPFLAIKENNIFFRDNTTKEGNKIWSYRFRKPSDVNAFGIAGNTKNGSTAVKVHSGKIVDTKLTN